ncbi:MAG TPA: ABC transporter substrate-binding protein, partial [bacterium]|nr:ABC transporter substrate-binding protein [bacterium]
MEKGIRMPSAWGLALLLAAVPVLSTCGGSGRAESSGTPVNVRLGYFPNLSHATAIVGVEKGIFARALAPDRVTAKTFNAGPAAVEALFSDSVDATYIGPNPAINAYAKSEGRAIRIVSGATSGGAALVVKPGITAAEGLKGKKVASPQLGGTQDVALRAWLRSKGLDTDPQGGGDVSVVPQENAQTLETFRVGQISGAWVPEPWATRLVQEGGGTVLVDERTLWPGGQFVTTHLIVRTEFLEQHPEAVRRLLRAQVEANDVVNQEPGEAQRLVNLGISEVVGKKLPEAVIAAAWKNLEFTNDPIASSLATSAEHAERIGLLEPVDLKGIYDLTLLNQVLREAGKKEVAS